MPRASIEYMNARRANAPASGGTNYRKFANPVDMRARDADRDTIDQCHDAVLAIFADFRAWFAESTRALQAGDLADGAETIPF